MTLTPTHMRTIQILHMGGALLKKLKYSLSRRLLHLLNQHLLGIAARLLVMISQKQMYAHKKGRKDLEMGYLSRMLARM